MFKVFMLTAAFAVFFACGQSNTQSNSKGSHVNASTSDTSTPVETRQPNSDYKPAFAGQTRIGAVNTKATFGATIVTKELSRPWGISPLPDGRFLVTQKEGTMVIVSNDGSVSAPIRGIPPVNAGGQGGLLDVTIDPEFSSTRMVYWTFSESTKDGNLTAVAKGTLAADEKNINNATVIYRATPAYNGTLHYGSRILVDKSGNLLISTGERSDLATRPQAQELNSALGKIIRITKDGQAALGNPFMNSPAARPELYSYGHRNVQGLAFHPITGDLWETEMGPRGGDELNRIEPGENYGWPVITYGIEYGGDKVGAGITVKEGMEQPVYYWDPVLSPSGMSFCSSDNISEWKNNLFICGLNSNHIARLVINDHKVVGEERLLSGEGQRFRDICQGTNGDLYAITDEGRLYRIGKK